MSKPLFSLGRVVSTPGALELIRRQGLDPLTFITRHVTGDWGDLGNKDGTRLLSAYKTPRGKLWIITEADRSATTLLLPDEY